MKAIYVDLAHGPEVQRLIDEAYIRGIRKGREQAYDRVMKLLEDECGSAKSTPSTTQSDKLSPTNVSTTGNPSGAT